MIESLYPHCDPIDPREPLSGGRCNALKIMYDVKENSDKEIKYIDICSLYPYVCKHKSYPVGQPKILTTENIDMTNIRQYEGIIKCKVLPPADLFYPILPVHCNSKMMFPLCMKCAEDSSVKCSHSKEERSLVGTWVTFELFKALACNAPLTVKHLLVDCIDLAPTRERYFAVHSLITLFETVKIESVFEFLKEIGLYKKI